MESGYFSKNLVIKIEIDLRNCIILLGASKDELAYVAKVSISNFILPPAGYRIGQVAPRSMYS
jgi:hypothetical protein